MLELPVLICYTEQKAILNKTYTERFMLVVYHLQEHLKLIVKKLKSCKDIDIL